MSSTSKHNLTVVLSLFDKGIQFCSQSLVNSLQCWSHFMQNATGLLDVSYQQQIHQTPRLFRVNKPSYLTFFQRFGFRAKQEQAATNQQFPTTPWFRSWELMPSTNRWGSSEISCSRDSDTINQTHLKDVCT